MISNYVIICKSFSIALFCLCGCRTTLQLATSALQQKQHPTYPALDLYLHIHRGRDYERESVHVQWAASHSDTPTHTPIVTKPTRAAGSETHARVTDRLDVGWSDLFFTFLSLLSALLCSHFVVLRGMQNKLHSLIEHCLFAYAVCIVLAHDSLKELCKTASLCHCNQGTWTHLFLLTFVCRLHSVGAKSIMYNPPGI